VALQRALRCLLCFAIPALILGASFDGAAAPIVGATQSEQPAPESQAPSLNLNVFDSSFVDPSATVIQFGVLRSETDSDQTETIIFVQKKGGHQICVNHRAVEIITRSYVQSDEEPLSVPSVLKGLTTGNSGDLLGFNETKVFIQPHSPEDEFKIEDECFAAGEAKGCFVPGDIDCDELLEESEILCVAGITSRTGCSSSEFSELMRGLRLLLAANQQFGGPPIITARGLDFGSEDIGELPGGGLPNGETGGISPSGFDGILLNSLFGGGGGSDFVIVPNLIGLTLGQAKSAIANAFLTLGNVGTAGSEASAVGTISLIKPAMAAECPPGPGLVTSQNPLPGQTAESGDPVSVLLCPQLVAAVDEPATVTLFAIGLALLVLVTWWKRRHA
jgi:hypothetical protein